ncbi:ABC transporter substrate-binding protein [Halomarina oriensis]|uniref:ABC transporter substrate-binding protein n=1 Tax=Halomarina oriensis TaxID=671145 RepID=A0A6B0GEG6_9EURY|nr:ABC transporter substrate-binding protein [Halomarina oriensis]MWG32920.1 ABC transporter substrate-binding protein [Halomarina oriensis]
MNVVSLLPSATELADALDVEPVAVSHECDWPPAAAERPTVVRTRIDAEASSGDIDEQVQTTEAAGDGVYAIDREALAAADPDLVVTQGLCDVCAVDEVVVHDALDDLGLDCEVLTVDPHSLADVFEDLRRLGEATGREARAEAVVADRRARVDAVRERTRDVPDDERPRTAVLDWLNPVMTAGHWMPELVEYAGGAVLLAAEASTPREWKTVREADPDVLVAAPCGFELDQTRENLADLTDREGFDGLTAVREGHAFVMDGHHYVNRPGPRLVDTLEHLAGLLHPERFESPPADVARPLAELRPERVTGD